METSIKVWLKGIISIEELSSSLRIVFFKILQVHLMNPPPPNVTLNATRTKVPHIQGSYKFDYCQRLQISLFFAHFAFGRKVKFQSCFIFLTL